MVNDAFVEEPRVRTTPSTGSSPQLKKSIFRLATGRWRRPTIPGARIAGMGAVFLIETRVTGQHMVFFWSLIKCETGRPTGNGAANSVDQEM